MRKKFKNIPVIEDIAKAIPGSDLFDKLIGDDGEIKEFGIIYTLVNNGIPAKIKLSITKDSMVPLKNILKKELKIPDSNIFSRYNRHYESSQAAGYFLFINSELFLNLDEYSAEIYYNRVKHKSLISEIRDSINDLNLKYSKKSDNFYLIVKGVDELHLRQFRLKPFEIVLEDNYNDDFLPIHKLICRSFNDKSGKGIVLLYGEPGTGKTTYIRYLARTLNKKIIYIPPQFSVNLTSWSFFSLMLKHPGSVIIIEDAEKIIEDRSNGKNLSISSLLNIADGLLSYCLKLRIICTFNTGLSKIDPALLRKGRLTALYEFKKLSVEKCTNLAQKIGIQQDFTSPMTIAEIYNISDSYSQYNPGRGVGYKH